MWTSGAKSAARPAEGRRDLGVCTDLLSGCPKGEGILMALRSLSPDLILCDEVGKEEEIRAVSMALNSGVPVVATIHASTLEELLARPKSGPFAYRGFSEGGSAGRGSFAM